MMTAGQTIYYKTTFDIGERSGVIQEVTSVGYLINGVWYSKNDIQIINVLLDSKVQQTGQLILG